MFSTAFSHAAHCIVKKLYAVRCPAEPKADGANLWEKFAAGELFPHAGHRQAGGFDLFREPICEIGLAVLKKSVV